MNTTTLIRRNLIHYWRTNAAVVAGVGVAVAVLAGALLVGDSVRGSLRALFLQRIGRAEVLVTANAFFRERLAGELAARAEFAAGGFDGACPVVALEGLVIHDESGRRAGGVAVYGVDERFWKLHGLAGRVVTPADGDALLSPALAAEFGARAGESLRVRIEKPSAIPVESLHGRKEDVGRTVRLNLREVLPADRLGEFSLRAQQGEVRAVFVSLARLQKETGQGGRANALLIAGKGADEAGAGARAVGLAEKLLRENVTLEDLGLRVRALEGQNALSLESESALLTEEVAAVARERARGLGLRPAGVFSYLANTIRANGREIPYSLVTAIEPEMLEQVGNGGPTVREGASPSATPTTTLGTMPGAPPGTTSSTTPSTPPSATPSATPSTTLGATPSATPSTTPDTTPSLTVGPLLLNQWAADDLGARVGDAVEIDYYLWREEGRLETQSARFTLAGVAPIAGLAADRDLTPDYPGISDTDSLSDWDPPFPLDLARVRAKDEDYWEEFRTTPKAFIALPRGQELWRTRFGTLTSLRLRPAAGASLEAARAGFERELRAGIDPLGAGFRVAAVREEGLRASRGATDFGEYFLYFSFFLVVSALLLASLFFKLGIEARAREIGLLRAVGFPAARVRALFLAEGLALAAAGSALGLLGALAYAWLLMRGLGTWWVDAVGTRALSLHVSPVSLGAGFVGGVLAALACVWLTLRALRHVSARSLLAGVFETAEGGRRGAEGEGRKAAGGGRREQVGRKGFALITAVVFGALGLSSLGLAAGKIVGETAGFFGAGVLLLISALAAQSAWLRRARRRTISGRGWWPLARLGFRGAAHRPARSVLCIALVASASFIIVAVEAFRQDGAGASAERKSGGGGYALMAETLLPVAHDPNSPEGREALGLDAGDGPDELAGLSFARFRVRPGDDASCLNLYQPQNPKLLGAPPDFIRQNRFSFQGAHDEAGEAERENPWLLLERDAGDGAIPVAADAKSLAYVLHKKIGDEIVVAGAGGASVRLRVVAALADSLFQSELLMSEKNFLRAFPEQQGYRYFLVDAPPERATAAGLLEDKLSDFGFDAVSTAERLASFHRVENTYLSTFQTLGGFGVLLGTLGLATVLLRNVFERRKELALLRAVGYGPRHFAVMIVAENALLLLCGLATGAACALLAVAPALYARGAGGAPRLTLALLLLAVLAAGFVASLAATAAALRAPLLPALRSE